MISQTRPRYDLNFCKGQIAIGKGPEKKQKAKIWEKQIVNTWDQISEIWPRKDQPGNLATLSLCYNFLFQCGHRLDGYKISRVNLA